MSRTLLMAAPPAFDPRTYGTLAWWLRGDDVTLNGSDVSSWNDKSGNARHWTQATGANQPAFTAATAINSRPGVTFTSANSEFLQGPDLSVLALAAAESFLVLKASADPSTGTLGILWRTGTSASDDYYPFTNGNLLDGFGSSVRKDAGNLVPSLASPRIYGVVTAAGEWTNYLDGVQQFTTATNTVGWRAVSLLGKGNGAVYGSHVMCEWIVYTAKLSTEARAAVVASLKSYYGIA